MMAPFRGPDAGRLLAAALLGHLPPGTILHAQHRTPWASATFSGTQHRLLLDCGDAGAATAMAERVADLDFALRGHLLADIEGQVDGAMLTITALTLIAA
ncbi:hypothetical protein [Sphingomonas sp.]|uniref:hypothetical protein n=1 Tax=Sphingomonas sp. TaxID=28214 RepID=UPI002ED9C783